jgi:putative ABC transport system permease protein
VERAAVTSNFFQVLGVSPAIGRAFTPEETNGDSARVAMISYATYQKRFGGTRDILQRYIEINGVPYRIVGVLPAEFRLSGMWAGFDRAKPEVWTPLNINVAKPESDFHNVVYGRLKPGVTLAQARSEVAVLEAQLIQQFPKDYDKHDTTNVFTLYTEDVAADLRRGLLVLQLAVGFVLLLACVNVANLMLARAENRQREMALRMALGASRGRVTRQVITESVLLGTLGAVPGLALAWLGTKLVAKLAPSDVLGLHELTLDSRVLAFTAATAVVAGMVFGLAPALHVSARNLLERVSRGGRGGTSGTPRRFRTALVVAEVALALAPLAGAGLMIRTLRAMNALDLGIRPDKVVDGRVELPEVQYKTKEQVRAFDNELLEKAAAAPGVEAAALAGGPPMQSINFTSFHLDGESTDREQTVDAAEVSDG